MPDAKVKGEVFLRTLDAVAARWGANGLDIIAQDHADYREERWYPLEEFCSLLSKVKTRLGSNNPYSIYLIGFRAMKDDPHWQDVFDDQDPAGIFLTTERQDQQFNVGTVKATTLGPKHVRVDYIASTSDPLWFEFYRGLLQGVLELTGRSGVVHLLPSEQGKEERTYDIKWG